MKKLIKELEYTESNYEYTSDIVNEADTLFIESINDFLDVYPDVKEIYDEKFNTQLNKFIENEKKKEIEIVEKEEEDEIIEKPIKIKKLYREIAKLTHTDVIKDERLNDFYLEATSYYDSDDKIGIYRICNELNIEYDLDEDDETFIVERIKDFKNKIGFLESTLTWKWYSCEDEKIKEGMIVDFIKSKI